MTEIASLTTQSTAQSASGHAIAVTVPAVKPSKAGASLRTILRLRFWLVIGPVRAYQRLVGPLKPRTCRFEPTCSQYMIDSVLCHGLIKGVWAGAWRILRCNPYGRDGLDPATDFSWWWEYERRQRIATDRATRERESGSTS